MTSLQRTNIYQENKTGRLRENIGKRYIWQRLLPKIYKELLKFNNKEEKKKHLILNMGLTLAQTPQRRRYTDGWWSCGQRFHIRCHQGNANQSHREVPRSTCQNDQMPGHRPHQMLVKMWGHGNACSQPVGMRNGSDSLQDSLVVSYNRSWPCHPTALLLGLPKAADNLHPHKSFYMDIW